MLIKKGLSKNRLALPTVIVGVAILGTIVFAQSSRRTVSASGIQANTDRAAQPAVALADASVNRKPLEYYVGSVRSDLFASPAQMKPAPKIEPVKKPIIVAAKPSAPAPVNPFADYSYNGTVTMGGEVMALVENVKTKEGQYLKQGDSFM